MIEIRDKTVCSSCAGESLGNFIKLHGEKDICNYCGNNKNKTMTIEQLLPRMYESWELYYETPEDYPALQTPQYLRYTSDIIEDKDAELFDAKSTFIEDLKKLVNSDDKIWLRKADIWTSFPEALKSSWERFSEIVKKQRRYTFFLCDKDESDPATYSPVDTMEIICELLNIKNALITELPDGTPIYRTRKDNAEFAFCAEEMGSAPSKYAKSNRFSPKGISMFYGSLDRDTCEKEAVGEAPFSITAKFYNSKPITLLDLTNIPPIPKLYDDDFGFIPAFDFLHKFSKDVSKDAEDDEINYIPTQIFTEYIRFQWLHKFNIKGIKYKSSKNENGINLVLFYTNDDCKDVNDGSDCLVLKNRV